MEGGYGRSELAVVEFCCQQEGQGRVCGSRVSLSLVIVVVAWVVGGYVG